MSYNDSRPSISIATPSDRRHQVENQIIDLENGSSELTKAIAELENRLNDVLRTQADAVGLKSEPEPILVPTAARLRNVSVSIQNATAQIANLLTRLEL